MHGDRIAALGYNIRCNSVQPGGIVYLCSVEAEGSDEGKMMAAIAITGAARGIGFGLARQHLAAGDRVLALARDPVSSEALNALAAGSAGRLMVYAMDVADDASVRASAADSGSDPIDILYNVAGIMFRFRAC